MPVMGAGVYVNRSVDEVALVPPGVVTVISTVPAIPVAGDVAVIDESEFTVKLPACVLPK